MLPRPYVFAALLLPAPTQSRPVLQTVSKLEAAVAARTALGFTVTQRDGNTVHMERAGLRLELRAGTPTPAALDQALELVAEPAPAAATLTTAGLRLDTVPESPGTRSATRARDTDGWTFFLRTKADAATPAIPRLGELNPLVLEVLRRYPADGTHTYHWPKGSSWKGCTKDLEYAGETLCAGDPQKRAYCCGLTFEVFLDAWRLWCQRNARPWRIRDLDLAAVRKLQTQWFGSEQDHSCMRTALCDSQLGTRITDLEDAQPGDFVQLWRHNKSGHSVVFLAWLRDGKTITGLRYWSTQDATKGIGEREERFGQDGRTLDRAQFWVVRAGG